MQQGSATLVKSGVAVVSSQTIEFGLDAAKVGISSLGSMQMKDILLCLPIFDPPQRT